MKKCSKCNILLALSCFSKLSRATDGLNYTCKVCCKIARDSRDPDGSLMRRYQQQYYLLNKQRVLERSAVWKRDNREQKKLSDKRWLASNKDHKSEKNRAWYEANKTKVLSKAKEYRDSNREHRRQVNSNWLKRNKQRRREYLSNINNRLAHNLRSRVNCMIRGRIKIGSAVQDIGCSIEELKIHLESKFVPGMTWENYGLKGWHIDHIVPLSSFDLTDVDQLKKAYHYTNLQPLWAEDNLSKGNKV